MAILRNYDASTTRSCSIGAARVLALSFAQELAPTV